MLRVGLTGGIGAGKSTVAAALADRGAVVIDADQLARAAVAVGTDGLAEVVEAFGPEVLRPDGALNRTAMATIVFADPVARERLNAIVHPRVGAASGALLAAAPADAVVVQEIPLLVENQLGARFQLVISVDAVEAERVERLATQRGMAAADAHARIAAQADDTARRAACDVWLDNSGNRAELVAAVERLWDQRLVPFEANLRQRHAAPDGQSGVVDPDPMWPAQAARLVARIALAGGKRAVRIEHIGSTAVPGLPARDVLDLQLGVTSQQDHADSLRPALEEIGFPPLPDFAGERVHAAADPGRPGRLTVRMLDSPRWRQALLMRDWLRADTAARREYAALKRRLGAQHGTDVDSADYPEAKRQWFDAAASRMARWSPDSEGG